MVTLGSLLPPARETNPPNVDQPRLYVQVVVVGGSTISEFLYRDAKEALAYLACRLHEHAIPESRFLSLIRALSRHRQSPDFPFTVKDVPRSWQRVCMAPNLPSPHPCILQEPKFNRLTSNLCVYHSRALSALQVSSLA
jgi:hypothetical protein